MRSLKTSENVAKELHKMILTRSANPSEMWGVAPWGIPTLDRITGGIQAQTVTYLGARPGVGKSTIACMIMQTVAEYFLSTGSNLRVKVVLSEMTAKEMQLRIVSSITGITGQAIKVGLRSHEDIAKVTEVLRDLAKLPIDYYDTLTTFSEIEDILRDSARPCGFWILDCIGQFIQTRQRDSTGASMDAANTTQRLCRDYAPGLIIAHMNRETERSNDKRPTLSNFSGTDQLGRNADLALALHRPWMYMELEAEAMDDVQPAELLMLKNRTGPTRDIKLLYNPTVNKFMEETESE